jgi:penicillin-binding protein 1C
MPAEARAPGSGAEDGTSGPGRARPCLGTAGALVSGRRRWLWLGLAAAGVLAALPAGLAGALYWQAGRLSPPPLAAAEVVSKTVTARDGTLLRAFTTPAGRWRLPATPEAVDPRYLAMLLAYEDARFERHGGVDPLAVLRAGWLFARYGRPVSGASTLTMQTARLLDGVHERTGPGKFRQMARALQLERQLDKRQILSLYLRLAPFGGNLEGVRAGALVWLGKEPRRLSVGEAALLVALPQSPELRRPDRYPGAARRARARVLARARAAGLIDRAEEMAAAAEPIPHGRRAMPRLAPHLAERLVAEVPGRDSHATTLDARLQAALEPLVREHARLAGPALSAALIVADHSTGTMLAEVGAADYLDAERHGAIDMTRAVRSPGSTLKPLIYGLGFEAGLAHPETLIEDRLRRFGSYMPKNFDEALRGDVSMREALALSLNIPAVAVLAAVGPARLADRMRRAGAPPVLPEGAEPSLPMALGGVGVTLADLTHLYAALARGGVPVALSSVPVGHGDASARQSLPVEGANGAPSRRMLSAQAAWYVADILKDAPAPSGARSGRIAYKTGTSYGYRDAWAVGFDGRHVVAAWVGRADAAAVPGLTGRGSAAPLLFDAFGRLGEQRVALAAPPRGVLFAKGGELPPPLRRFRAPGEAEAASGPFATRALSIAFPPDRAEIEAEPGDPLVLKAEGGTLPLTWIVDDRVLASEARARETAWRPPGPGFAKVTVIDAEGRVDRATVRLR